MTKPKATKPDSQEGAAFLVAQERQHGGRPVNAAELRERIIELWTEQLSCFGDLLLLEAQRHGHIPRKVRIGYLLSAERARLCREFAERIVNDIERMRAMQELATMRALGVQPLEH
ncbi:MAG: hypothetical protein HKL99_16825 [Burkholderiales bacterium]|jgi:hypothetical protein|nr:hypothetical protein [Burkholderiales bacterium]